MIDMYHFAPMELYVLFGVGVACYAISSSRSASRHPPSKISRLVEWMVPLLFYASWVPLLLHYIVILFWLPPTIFINLSGVLSDPNGLHEVGQYIAYYVHIGAVALFFLWILFLLRVRRDDQDGSSDGD